MTRLLVLGVCALLVGLSGSTVGGASTYYIDCGDGDDANPGTEAEPWATFKNVPTLVDGDTLLLQRGETCYVTDSSDDFEITDDITVDAYGTGAYPIIDGSATSSNESCVRLDDSGITIKHIRVQNCDYANFRVGATDALLSEIEAWYAEVGVRFVTGVSDRGILEYSEIHSNNHDPNCMGVLLQGDDVEIRYNHLSGNICGEHPDYHGSAVEIYNASRAYVHHNFGEWENAFTEIGKHPDDVVAEDNVFEYNVANGGLPDASFLITRGPADEDYGPVLNTVAENNLAFYTGETSDGWTCYADCGYLTEHFTSINNVIKAETQCGYEEDDAVEDWGLYDEACDSYVFTAGDNTVIEADLSTYDYDGDGYLDWQEQWVGIDRFDDCPDGSSDAAWMPDFDNNRRVNITDIFYVMPPYFGSSWGDPLFSQRIDVDPNGVINITDYFVVNDEFGNYCTN